MAKLTTVLGLMSGTSMDGIDAALLRTDGENALEFLGASFTPYPEDVKNQLRKVLGKSSDDDGQVALTTDTITNWHIKAVKDFVSKTEHKIELVGFHGQTIFHDPANAKTWQIGDGARLASATGIDVVYDFRTNDMKNGGQGAPLLPVYHKALVKAAGLSEPVCVLNLGGVGNITWIEGDEIIACDTGPANALIDDWMLQHTGRAMDANGAMAALGAPDQPLVSTWLEHAFFTAPAPKSLDRNAFAHCCVDDLSVADGAATLTAFTVQSVFKALQLMPSMPKQLIVAGGGRHNATIMQALARSVPTMNADALGWRGDSMEAEGFAYLAKRSVLGLPLSFPTTTGCKIATTGGKFIKF